MQLMDYNLYNWDKPLIHKQLIVNNIKIVLLKLIVPGTTKKEGSKNLLGLDGVDKILWIADLPEDYPHASYGDIRYQNNVFNAWCGSIYCEIDPLTGKILKEQFTK